MQFLDCKITLSFSNQKIKDRSETLINKGKYEVKIKFIVSLIIFNFNYTEVLKKQRISRNYAISPQNNPFIPQEKAVLSSRLSLLYYFEDSALR